MLPAPHIGTTSTQMDGMMYWWLRHILLHFKETKMPENEEQFTRLGTDEVPYITYILLVINILVFIGEMVSGGAENTETLLKMGAQYWPNIGENGEWYRIFTSMFLHIGIEHLVGNMICLIAIGPNVESYFGHIKYIIIYIVAGLCGSLLSLTIELFTLKFYVSAGASGARTAANSRTGSPQSKCCRSSRRNNRRIHTCIYFLSHKKIKI